MPCFKGIAVSVHAEGAPLPEFGLQKQSRVSRVNTYIPVPKPKLPEGSSSTKPEPSKFAISITLLTPGLPVPYSTPKPSETEPYPQPQIVGGLPGIGAQRGHYTGPVGPYLPITKSDNETIAAYIYFDGRAKEEVATLLRPGEETWVNSRWVQVAGSEGGGLAEREFLFREVGLERWLNGLDLDGHDAAAKIEKRRQKFDKRRRHIKKENDSDDEKATVTSRGPSARVLKYGRDEMSPVERMSDEESSDSDDDGPPEAAGQIKVAMFRVLASGEIKKGEYSPQFDAHDDDEGSNKGAMEEDGEDVDHTTSFAKPKTLDPKSISTQTVTGIDGPEKPFAVFTFFYRGERQLQKMGIFSNSKQQKVGTSFTKRSSGQVDFSNIGPLNSGGTVGFSTFRDNDPSSRSKKARKKSNGSAGVGGGDAVPEDSDEEEEDADATEKMEDVDDKDVKIMLSPEDAKRQGELAEGVDRIKLKRQHSADNFNAATRPSPNSISSTSVQATPPADSLDITSSKLTSTLPPSVFGAVSLPNDGVVGSPFKKQRASVHDTDDNLAKRMGAGFSSGGDIVAAAEAAQVKLPDMKTDDGDEELL